MTCRLCGARIGILERWRHGDFCSREHKEEFAYENERLAEEILRDLRRPGAAPEPVAIDRAVTPERAEAKAEAKAEAEVEAPEPVAAGHIAQQGASPLRAAGGSVREEAPRARPGWKEFASLANLDRAPVAGAKPKLAHARVLWIEAPPREEGCYVHMRKRSLGLPHTHYRRRRPALRLFDHLVPIDPTERAQASAVTVDPALWEGWPAEGGNGWDAGSGNVHGPGIEAVLEGYPITAPWDRWERWPVAAPATLAPGGQDAAAESASRRAPRAAAYPGAVPGGPLMPRPGAAPPAQAARAGGARGRAQQPAAVGGIVMPGGAGVAFPAYPGAGGGGRGGGPIRGGGGYGLPFAGAWREMAPPMFLAQSDPAAGLDPLDRPCHTFAPANAFAHARPRIFRPRPRLLPPQPRVPEPSLCLPVRVRLADGWTPKPAEPVRWRP